MSRALREGVPIRILLATCAAVAFVSIVTGVGVAAALS